jgi:phosphatidate phosphatase APP1
MNGSKPCLLLLALLGLAAPAAELKPGEQVVFYPTPGWRAANGWEVEIHGCVYEMENRRLALPLLRRALGLDDEELSPAERAIYRQRAQLFLVDHQADRTVAIQLAGREYRLGPSSDNGHLLGHLLLPTEPGLAPGLNNRPLPFEALRPAGLPASTGAVHLLAETGLSVISDVDDTIKISRVRDRRELLRNTFCRPFEAVPGMAGLYQGWVRAHDAAFHYVSASPWQLYLPLADFVRSNGFPAGTFHLKHLRVKDGTFLDLFDAPERSKESAIETLLARFPRRQFMLVGDSGEQDPELYAGVARQHGTQVRHIFIRNVTGEPAAAPRYQNVFAGLPAGLWRVFEQPKQVEEALGAAHNR